MNRLKIAENGDDVFIYLNKKELGSDKVDNIISQIQLMLIDDSHIPEMSDEEQAEIEKILDARTQEDKENAFVETVSVVL